MAVTPELVISKTSTYTPATNILSTSEMTELATATITKIGDADSNLNSICCSFLIAIGEINSTLASIGASGLRREKLGQHEREYFESAGDNWEEYVVKVKNTICPLFFGVSKKYTVGATVNSSPQIEIINNCVNKYTI